MKPVYKPDVVNVHDSALLEELEQQLRESSMDSLLNEAEEAFKEGEVVRGRIVEIGSDRVLVDIGYKSEGVVARSEFSEQDPLEIGQEFDFCIENPEDENGMPVLSKIKADRIRNWEHVQKVYEENGVIEGVITRRVKGGLKVDIGIDAFMPASQLSFRPVGDLERFVGQKMEFKIIKLTRRRRNVVVSHRKLVEERRLEEKRRLMETIKEGAIIKGEVKNITEFGAFVDVGGIDGLLHVTDMSWGRVKHPGQMLKVGDEIEVKVLSFDPATERISLGLKQKTENPWLTAEERYPVGSIHRGKVVSITEYGAFVQFDDGLEGMVHVSEMSWTRRVRHPNEVLSLDQEVDVMVLSVDAAEQKMALGIKQTQPNPWKTMHERYPIGSVVKGVVRNMTEYGAFIQLDDGIDALLHVSDMSWTKKITNPSEVLTKGQEIEVQVLSIDAENEKISVGLKQLQTDPWIEVVKDIPVGSHVEVTITKLVSFGAFADLGHGVEGLIHVSELSNDRVNKPEDVLKIGDKVMAKVININHVDRKIGLSVREYERDLERQNAGEYQPGAVDVSESLRGAVPSSMIQAGRSLEDVAHELMMAVSRVEAAKAAAKAEGTGSADKTGEGAAAPDAPAPETVRPSEETSDGPVAGE